MLICGRNVGGCVTSSGLRAERTHRLQATRGEMLYLNSPVVDGRICYDIDEVLERHRELLAWLPKGSVDFIRKLLHCDPLQRISLADAIQQSKANCPTVSAGVEIFR